MVEPIQFVEQNRTTIESIKVLSIVTIDADNALEVACSPDSKPWIKLYLKVNSGSSIHSRIHIITDGDMWLYIGTSYRMPIEKINIPPDWLQLTTTDQRSIHRALRWWTKTL